MTTEQKVGYGLWAFFATVFAGLMSWPTARWIVLVATALTIAVLAAVYFVIWLSDDGANAMIKALEHGLGKLEAWYDRRAAAKEKS